MPIGRTALVGWALSALAGSALVGHAAVTRTGSTAAVSSPASLAAALAPEDERAVAAHVLFGGCPASERLVTHLAARRALRDYSERVVYVAAPGEDAEPTLRRLRSAGFAVETPSSAELHGRLGLGERRSPLLAIVDQAGRLRYAGGYTETAQSPVPRDLAYLDAVAHGAWPEPLPLAACPTP